MIEMKNSIKFSDRLANQFYEINYSDKTKTYKCMQISIIFLASLLVFGQNWPPLIISHELQYLTNYIDLSQINEKLPELLGLEEMESIFGKALLVGVVGTPELESESHLLLSCLGDEDSSL